MADVLSLLNDSEGYKLLSKACGSDGIFKDIQLQSWHPDDQTEKSFFNANVLKDFGATVTTTGLPPTIKDYATELKTEKETFPAEDSFSNKKLSFFSLHLMASRHFRNIVPPNTLRDSVNKS